MTRRAVVAVVTDAVYPFHRGGKEIRYYEVLRRLAPEAEIHVYTMKWWSGPRTKQLDGITYHAICREVPLYTNGRRSLVQAAWFASACVRLVREPFDVLEADHIPYAPIYVLRLVTWLRRKPLVVTWHEVWGKDAWTAYLGWLGRVAWLVEKGAMRLPDRIIAASPQTGSRLASVIGPKARITVAPNGLDLRAITEAEARPDRSDVVFVGRLLRHKGVDVLIDALVQLAARDHPVSCRVIGQGPELDALRRRAADRGVAGQVEFLDDVTDQRELYSLVKAADVFVFPSVREGFGIAVLEAMACGLPVVTSNHPDNLAQFLVDTPDKGIVCDPEPTSVANAIERLLAQVRSPAPTGAPSVAQKGCAARGAIDITPYDWDTVALTVADALGVPHG